MFLKRFALTLLVVFSFVQIGTAQQNPALTNDDVIKMVKSKLPETTIVNAIQASDTNFDVSANGLIALQKAGITQPVMNAMIAASSKKHDAATAAPAATAAAAAPAAAAGPAVGTLKVVLVENGKQQPLPLEKTQLAQTKSKASSLSSLSTDAALNQVFQAGVNEVAWEALSHGGYGGYTGVSAAGSVMSGIMSRKKPNVTYVWALPGPASSNVVSSLPTLDVTYSGIPGVNADQYEPAIVKLAPTSNNWRLIGAAQGKADALQSSDSDWDVYSTFVEEKVATQTKKLETGHVQITPAGPMAAGQYAVVLRPQVKAKKFAGADVGKDQGEGLMFDSAWSFTVK
ncbi:MAG: hypothetical protein NVS9B4_14620 [Candidatus Acidiferrum sp.]